MQKLPHRMVFGALIAASLLSACGDANSKDATKSYQQAHPIEISRKQNQIVLNAALNRTQLDHDMHSQLSQFVHEKIIRDPYVLFTISHPQNAGNSMPRPAIVVAVVEDMKKMGVADTSISIRPNIQDEVSMESLSEIMLISESMVARGPACQPEVISAKFTGSNRRSKAFGCSTQSNLAMMVANPRDLLEPRDSVSPSYSSDYQAGLVRSLSVKTRAVNTSASSSGGR